MLPSELEHEDTAERDRFMAALDRRGGGASQGVQWEAPVELGGHSMALLAARRLKDISVYLLFFAFVLLLLSVGLGVALGVAGGLPGMWSPFAFVAGVFVGVLCFLVFKSLSDTVRALADMTDLARSLEARVNHIADLLERDEHEGA
jgi:hypothetical protein